MISSLDDRILRVTCKLKFDRQFLKSVETRLLRNETIVYMDAEVEELEEGGVVLLISFHTPN